MSQEVVNTNKSLKPPCICSDYVISWFDSIFPRSYCEDFVFQCELCPVIRLMEEKWANQFIGTFTYLMVKGSIKQPLRVQTAVLVVIAPETAFAPLPGDLKSPDL